MYQNCLGNIFRYCSAVSCHRCFFSNSVALNMPSSLSLQSLVASIISISCLGPTVFFFFTSFKVTSTSCLRIVGPSIFFKTGFVSLCESLYSFSLYYSHLLLISSSVSIFPALFLYTVVGSILSFPFTKSYDVYSFCPCSSRFLIIAYLAIPLCLHAFVFYGFIVGLFYMCLLFMLSFFLP